MNSNDAASQMTCPSETQSPISSINLGSTEQFQKPEQLFPSVPSLPALVSGASSVSADTEGEFLQRPGVVRQTDTTDSTPQTMTPPSLSKQPSTEVETPTVIPGDDTILLSPDEDDDGYNGDGDNFTIDDDDDSDSDEGLTMTRSKPKAKVLDIGKTKKTGRRGTNASVGSTETAKKVVMDN